MKNYFKQFGMIIPIGYGLNSQIVVMTVPIATH